jgi:hypothetical protein
MDILQSESNNIAHANIAVPNRTDSSVAKEKPQDPGSPVVPHEIVMVKPERRETRRKILELTKESFRDRMPLIYTCGGGGGSTSLFGFTSGTSDHVQLFPCQD